MSVGHYIFSDLAFCLFFEEGSHCETLVGLEIARKSGLTLKRFAHLWLRRVGGMFLVNDLKGPSPLWAVPLQDR